MGACEQRENAFEEAVRERDEHRDELRNEQREQFGNYQDYLGILRDGFVEFVILARFGEGRLGMSLGGYTMFLSGEVNNLEDEIGTLHDKIEQTKEDLGAAEAAADEAARELCDCYAEHGFE